MIDGVAPVIDELVGDRVNPGDRVKLVADGELLAIANYVPGGVRKRPGDFELLKVFPPEKEC